MDKQPQPHPALSAHFAKLAFRALLPIFAEFWQQACDQAPADSRWPAYFALLRACQDVLSRAPLHPNEARQINVERRYERSLERLATTLAQLFPNGFLELESYVVTDEVRAWRRAAGLARARRKHRHRSQRRRR